MQTIPIDDLTERALRKSISGHSSSMTTMELVSWIIFRDSQGNPYATNPRSLGAFPRNFREMDIERLL